MTGVSSASSVTGAPPKWQFALAVAAPVALGFGYMYYKNNGKTSRDEPKISPKENGAIINKKISVDMDCPPTKITSEPETVLEKAQTYKNEGNDLFKAGKFDEAIQQYNNAIEICSEEDDSQKEALATFYQNRAAAYEQLKKYNAVIADCTKALELNPNYTKALLRRAKAYEHCKELEAALADINALKKLEDNSNSWSELKNKILRAIYDQTAKEYFKNRKILPNKYLVEAFMKTFPNDPIFTMLDETDYSNTSLGLVKVLECLKEHRYDDVIPVCTEEINKTETESDKMKLLLIRATFYFLLEEHNAAIEDLGIIINSETVSKSMKINALIKRASSLIKLKDSDKCYSDFEAAIKLDPDCCDIYYTRGRVHLFMDKIDEVRQDFEKAYELNPSFLEAHIQKYYIDYQCCVKNKDVDSILEIAQKFKELLEKYSDCIECYNVYAQMLLGMGKCQKAGIYFAKAIEIEPNNGLLYVQKGVYHFHWNYNLQKALEYINKAIEVDYKCQYAYETLAMIHCATGNIEEGIRLFEEASKICAAAK